MMARSNKTMIGKKRNRGSDERLEQLGRELVHASASNEAEGEETAASPFLYARLRSRIKQERVRREEGESWLTMLGVVWRAVPAMALVAIFALSLFLSANFGTRPSVVIIDDALLGASDAGVENVVFADNRALSSDEVLATILNEDEQEASR
jgi:anti-sigma-K factor RskA